jgi:excisionase family DNA binding protein
MLCIAEVAELMAMSEIWFRVLTVSIILRLHCTNNSRNRFTLSTNFLNSNDWISQAEAARIRGVSRQAVAKLIKNGRLKITRIAGRVLVSKLDVENFKPKPAGRPVNDE